MGGEIQGAGFGAPANAGVQGRGEIGGNAEAGRPEAVGDDDVILKGGGVVAIVHATAAHAQPVRGKEEALIGLIQQEYEATKAIVDNLKPSEREIENRERRLQELKELEMKLRERKVEYNEALKTFINMLDPDDVAALRKLSDKAVGIIVG